MSAARIAAVALLLGATAATAAACGGNDVRVGNNCVRKGDAECLDDKAVRCGDDLRWAVAEDCATAKKKCAVKSGAAVCE